MFKYDNLGNRTTLNFGNGASQDFAYDPVGRLASLTANLSGTINDLTIGSIAYNPASQIVSLNRSNDSYAWNGHYNENRGYTSNGLNQLTSSGPFITPTYDLRGNLTSAGSTTYTYNSENMLLTATGGITLNYDPLLRLNQVMGPSTTTRFAYDGLRAIAEFDGAGTLQRRYVFGAGLDEALVQYEGSGTATRRFLHADERGSIVAVSDASGALFAKNTYDEYGIPGSANYGRFQYTGQMWLPELGMYHYKARIYSPTLGRFLQTDPIGYGDGPNWYNYVGGDPVNGVDPLGLDGDVVVTGTPIYCGPWADWDKNTQSCISNGLGYLPNLPSFLGLEGSSWLSGLVISEAGSPGAASSSSNPQCPSSQPKPYPIPDGYKPYPGDPQNRYVLDSRNTIQINPNYQSVVNNSHIDWWGVALDLAGIALSGIPIAGEYIMGGHLTIKSIDIVVAGGEVAGGAVETEKEIISLEQNSCNTGQ